MPPVSVTSAAIEANSGLHAGAVVAPTITSAGRWAVEYARRRQPSPAGPLVQRDRVTGRHEGVGINAAEAAAIEDQRLATAVRDTDDAPKHQLVVAGRIQCLHQALVGRAGSGRRWGSASSTGCWTR